MKRKNSVLITDAPESPEKELRRREIRYVAMMLVRAVCLIGAAVLVVSKPPLWGLWAILALLSALLLPWLAVLLANDQPAKKSQSQPPAGEPTDVPALPGHKVIDHD